MTNIIKTLKDAPDFIGSNGREEEAIQNAEQLLNVKFAPDYREYLKHIGLASFDCHELTGLTDAGYLNVVSVTQEQRLVFQGKTLEWYVIEEEHIDGIVIWQATDSSIYLTAPNTTPKKTASSLSEYIQQLL